MTEILETQLRAALNADDAPLDEARLRAGVRQRLVRRTRRRAGIALGCVLLAAAGLSMRTVPTQARVVEGRRPKTRQRPPFSAYIERAPKRTARVLADEAARLETVLDAHLGFDDERADLLYQLGCVRRDQSELDDSLRPAALTAWRRLFDEPRLRNAAHRDEALLEAALIAYDDEPVEAQRDLQRIIDEQPRSKLVSEAHVGRGDDLFEKKDVVQALEHYEKVAPGSNVWRYAQYKIGWAHVNLDEKAEAVAAFRRAAAGDARDPIVAASREELLQLGN